MSERDDISARKDSNNIVLGAYTAQLPNLIVSAGGCWPILCVPFTKTTPHFPFIRAARGVYLQKYILHTVTWHPALVSVRTLFGFWPPPQIEMENGWCSHSLMNFPFPPAGGSQRAFMQKTMCGLFSLFDWAESDTDYLKLSNLHTNTTRERFLPRCWLGALGKMHTKSRLWWKTRGVLPSLLVCE